MIALSGVPDVGPSRFRNLVAFFGSPENVFKASIKELQKELNEAIYKLYGLDDQDVRIIEDFLRKF